MRTALIAYIATAVVFFGMDFVWLSLSQGSVYRPRIGELLLDKPNLPVAAVFYLLYVVGVVFFAVLPAIEQGGWTRALIAGTLFGLVAYGTYDMTNLATLKNWSVSLSIIDMAWGCIATGTAATAGCLIARAVG